MIFILFFYIGLALVWAILGAVLNPTAYLAYAAAAGTFLAFVQLKISQLR